VRRLLLGSAGYLPSSVEVQRAMLPPAADCDDPVAGTWRAKRYSGVWREWVTFTLVITRADGDDLEGSILAHTWAGDPMDREPGPCLPGMHDYVVRMTGRGSYVGGRVRFGARSFRVARARCPMPGFDYNPDNFSGVLDLSLNEFQSVNNDGGRDVNTPYVFRRVSCETAD
jgi:hypothetical protein